MQYLVLSLAFVIAHVALYAGWLRFRDTFRRERTIFLYHLFSWILGTGAIGLAAWTQEGWRVGSLAVLLSGSLHGIYSLSFLELWSLTQGSYSLSILAEVERDPGLGTFLADASARDDIGREKREARLLSLQRLGLLDDKGDPTIPGRAIAAVVRGIVALSLGRNLNH